MEREFSTTPRDRELASARAMGTARSRSSTIHNSQQGALSNRAPLTQTYIQIGSGFSPSLSRSRVRFPSLYASGTLSARLDGCTRLAVQSLGDKAASQLAIPEIVHRQCVPLFVRPSVKSPWTEGMPTSCQSLPKWSAK